MGGQPNNLIRSNIVILSHDMKLRCQLTWWLGIRNLRILNLLQKELVMRDFRLSNFKIKLNYLNKRKKS